MSKKVWDHIWTAPKRHFINCLQQFSGWASKAEYLGLTCEAVIFSKSFVYNCISATHTRSNSIKNYLKLTGWLLYAFFVVFLSLILTLRTISILIFAITFLQPCWTYSTFWNWNELNNITFYWSIFFTKNIFEYDISKCW